MGPQIEKSGQNLAYSTILLFIRATFSLLTKLNEIDLGLKWKESTKCTVDKLCKIKKIDKEYITKKNLRNREEGWEGWDLNERRDIRREYKERER